MSLAGVYYKEQSDGSITFHDQETKNIVWLMPQPVMYEQDDMSQGSYGLHYEVATDGEDFIITKVIDDEGQEWLEQANYPIVIDYTLTLWGTTGANALEGYMRRQGIFPASYYAYPGATIGLTGGYSSGGWSYYDRSFFNFDVSSLGSATITSAYLEHYSRRDGTWDGLDFNIYAGADAWSSFGLIFESDLVMGDGDPGTDDFMDTFNITTLSTTCAAPADCRRQINIPQAWLWTLNTGTNAQFLFVCSSGPCVSTTTYRGMRTYMTSYGQSREPRLILEIPVTPPNLDPIPVPTVQNQLVVTLDDLSNNENSFMMQRRQSPFSNWSDVCVMNTGAPGNCGTDVYNCSSTSTLGTTASCTYTDNGLASNTEYSYRAYAVRSIPAARSPDSNVVSKYTLVAAISQGPTVAMNRWNKYTITAWTGIPSYIKFCIGVSFSAPYGEWPPVAPTTGTRYLVNRLETVGSDNIQDWVLDAAPNINDCHTVSEWTALGIPSINAAGAYIPYPIWPNRDYRIGLYGINNDSVITNPTATTDLYSRARRPSLPGLTNITSSSALLIFDRTPSDGYEQPPDESCYNGQPCVCGDVNQDGLRNISDVIYLNGGSPILPADYFWTADSNGDGEINSLDLFYLFDGLTGLHNSWNCGGTAIINPDWTEYSVRAVQTNPAGLTYYVNASTSQLSTSQSWWPFDSNGGTPNWGGGIGNTINLAINTCYDFTTVSRNNVNYIEGAILGQDKWSTPAVNICTLANVPGQPTVNCNYDTTNRYYCDVTINPNGNPNGTYYQIQYSNDITNWYDIPPGWTPYPQGFPGTYTFRHRPLTCDASHGTYYYRVRARNMATPPVPTDWSSTTFKNRTVGYDTLPPCQPESMRHTSNPIVNQGAGDEYPIYWAWNASNGGESVGYYNFYDANDNCLAGLSSSFCTLDGPREGPIIPPPPYEYQQFKNLSNSNLSPNVSYGGYVIPVDIWGRRGQASSTATFYNALAWPTGVSFPLDYISTQRIRVIEEGTPSDQLRLGQSSVQFNVIPLPDGTTAPGGGGETEFDELPNANKNISVDDEGLSPNRQYCYQARACNGDCQDDTTWDISPYAPAGATSCVYTLAAEPHRPLLDKDAGETLVNVEIRNTDDNPHGPVPLELDAPDTEYALCVTEYDENTGNLYTFYANTAGVVERSCDLTGYYTYEDCTGAGGVWFEEDSCVVGDTSGNWATYSQWGGDTGTLVNLNTAGKYNFRFKARNEDGRETEFGRPATLFLVKNNVVGWAWSSNIGWISLNCLNFYSNYDYDYSCDIAGDWGLNTHFEPTRDINPLEGYAWSGAGQSLGYEWKTEEKISQNVPAQTNAWLSADKNIAIDSAGYPHIVWSESVGGDSNPTELFYQKWNGNDWVKADNTPGRDNISNSSTSDSMKPSLVLGSDNNPHIAWTDSPNQIYYIKWDTSASAWVDVDGVGQGEINVTAAVGSGEGQYPSLQVDENNYPHIVWEDIELGSDPIVYSQWNGSNWFKADGVNTGFDTFSTAITSGDPNPSLDIESGTGYPHIVWRYDVDNIYYNYWDESTSSWLNRGGSDVISGITTGTGSPSIILGNDNNPHIAWGDSTAAYYQKWNSTNARWETVDGFVVDADRANCQAISGDSRGTTQLQLDDKDYPHIIATAGYPKYRYWNPYVNAGAGAWVTVSNDYGAGVNDPNLFVSGTDTMSITSLALDQNNYPHVLMTYDFYGDPGGGLAVYYNYWGEVDKIAGLGWISFNKYVCDNDTQTGCLVVTDPAFSVECGNTAACIESAGVSPDDIAYGFCYVDDTAAAVRYGICSDNALADCTENDVNLCDDPITATCILETCQTGGTCSDYDLGHIIEDCRDTAMANFNGASRRIDGWARILSAKDQGKSYDPPFNDWGWLKLGGQYDNGQGDAGEYALSGTEIDSQLFLGDPDVASESLSLYTLLGWGWNADLSDFNSFSEWLPPTNVSKTNEAIEHPMALDSQGNPHFAWIDVDGYYCSNNLLQSCTSNEECGDVNDYCQANDAVYYLKWSNEADDWVDVNYEIDGDARDDIKVPNLRLDALPGANCVDSSSSSNLSLEIDSGDHPHILWEEHECNDFAYEGLYYLYWNGSTWQEYANQDSTPQCPGGEYSPLCENGYYSDMVLDRDDNPHLVWEDPGGNNIFYSHWDPLADGGLGKWVSVTGDVNNLEVDNTSTYSSHASISLSNETIQRPHIAWNETEDNSTDKGNIYYRYWDGLQLHWVTASGNFTDPGDGDLDADLNVSQLGLPNTNGSISPVIAVDSTNYANIAYGVNNDETSHPNIDNQYVYFRKWNGSAWVTVSDDPATGNNGAHLFPDSNSVHAYHHDLAAMVLDEFDNPHIAWGDQTDDEIFYRYWNGSEWVTVSRDTNDTNRNVSNTSRESRHPSIALDKLGNVHIAWWDRTLDASTNCAPSNSYNIDGVCIDTSYPYCSNDYADPNQSCSRSDIMYTRWSPGKVQGGIGWVEFMPAGALLGVPWVQTAFADIFAADNISLAPPPRGSGQYTSTYLILSNGDIQGIPTNYSGNISQLPTSQLYEFGLNPLISGTSLPFGENALSKIDVATLTTDTNGDGKNKYGHGLTTLASGDLSNTLGVAPVLNGTVFYVAGDTTIDSNITITKGLSTSIPPTTGNGLIVVDGDLEINADIYYDTTALANISEMPSVAFIVRGNIYINPFVEEISGAIIALDNPNTIETAEGTISTSRQTPMASKISNAAVNDTYVNKNGAVYSNNYNASELIIGGEEDVSSSNRTFLRWEFGLGKQFDIPPGSEIVSAYIKLRGNGTSASGDFNSRIYLAGDPYVEMYPLDNTGFPNAEDLYNIKVNNSISYELIATDWVSDGYNHTPNIKSLVNKYIDSEEYTSRYNDNDPATPLFMGIEISNGDAEAGESRTFYAEDHLTGDAPELVIEYSPRRVRYGIENDNNTASSWSNGINDYQLCGINCPFGWSDQPGEGSFRTYLRFTNIDIPTNAEIQEAHLRSKLSRDSTDYYGDIGFQVRQGLIVGDLGDYNTTTGHNPFDDALDQSVSEIAQDLADGEWITSSGVCTGAGSAPPNGISCNNSSVCGTGWCKLESVVFDDIAKLVESFISRGDYAPGVSGNAMSLRLRRGNNLGESTAGSGEIRSIRAYNTESLSFLDVDYLLPLKVNGLLIAEGFNFDRKYSKDLAPAERIVYDGRVLANTPPGLSDFIKALPLYQRVAP
ncbi:MAG: dockerin type I repeat-containing protein [bacterium]|nr:dockerin type I repeat-containing protein [bacterium]